jgi:hypothetical protein
MTETNDVLRQRITLLETITALEKEGGEVWSDVDELCERARLLTGSCYSSARFVFS